METENAVVKGIIPSEVPSSLSLFPPVDLSDDHSPPFALPENKKTLKAVDPSLVQVSEWKYEVITVQSDCREGY